MSQSLLKGSYHLQHLFMIEDMIRCKRQNFWHFNLPHSKKKWLKDMRWMQSVFRHIPVVRVWFGMFRVNSWCVPPRLRSIPGYQSAFLHVSEQILVSRECSAMICGQFPVISGVCSAMSILHSMKKWLKDMRCVQ